ncbi:MAG: glycerol-3-phosphate dehydrogenase [Parvularculales bacterium]
MTHDFDIAVVGGGINGAAVARDAAGRGLRVFLAERDDYAAATSSTSSKLIHGGLRYLEQFNVRLVRESLRERQILLANAPHLVWPLRFLMPLYADSPRPAWMVRLGLGLYDGLSFGDGLEASGALGSDEVAGLPYLRRSGLGRVLHYADCWGNDARLVVELLMDARAHGADVGNYRDVNSVRPVPDGWRVAYTYASGRQEITARFVVNAAGPWVNDILERVRGVPAKRSVRLVRGSHIVVEMPFDEGALGLVDRVAWTLQGSDRRVIFMLPWLGGRFLIIGTTEIVEEGDPAEAYCSEEERDYLLGMSNYFFRWPHGDMGAGDIVSSWSGVRPLLDDGRAEVRTVSRDYRFEVERNGRGGLVSVYGGKLTTHRALAEKLMKVLGRMGLEVGESWTARGVFPGGELARVALEEEAACVPEGVASGVWRRWCFTYGSRARAVLGAGPLGEIAEGVPEAELCYAWAQEGVKRADDFLNRRTRMALTLSDTGRGAVEAWFGDTSAADKNVVR